MLRLIIYEYSIFVIECQSNQCLIFKALCLVECLASKANKPVLVSSILIGCHMLLILCQIKLSLEKEQFEVSAFGSGETTGIQNKE